MRTTSVLAALAATTLLVGGSAGAASAETQTRVDQRGDSVAFGPQARFAAPAAADILELRATHGDGTLTFRFDMRDLEQTESDETNVAFARMVSPGGRDYYASVAQQVGNGSEKEVFLQRRQEEGFEPVECEELEGRVLRAQDRMVISVPRSCINNPRSVRFGGLAYAVDNGGTPQQRSSAAGLPGGQQRFFADDVRRNGSFNPQTVRLGTRELKNN